MTLEYFSTKDLAGPDRSFLQLTSGLDDALTAEDQINSSPFIDNQSNMAKLKVAHHKLTYYQTITPVRVPVLFNDTVEFQLPKELFDVMAQLQFVHQWASYSTTDAGVNAGPITGQPRYCRAPGLFSWTRYYLQYATQAFWELNNPILIYVQHKLHIQDQTEYDNLSKLALYDADVATRVALAKSAFWTFQDIMIPWKLRMEHYFPNFSLNARISLFVQNITSSKYILQPESGNPTGATAPANPLQFYLTMHGVHLPREKRELIIGLTRRLPDPSLGFPGGIYFEWDYFEYQQFDLATGTNTVQIFNLDNFKFPAVYTLIIVRLKSAGLYGQGDAGGNNEYLDFVPIDEWKISAYDKYLTPDYVWDVNQNNLMPKFFNLNEPQLVCNAHTYCLNPNDKKAITGFQTWKDFDKPKLYVLAMNLTATYTLTMINFVRNSSHLYDGEIYKPLR
jgi:hypothetical protein